MKVLLVRSDFSEFDIRRILRLCRMIEYEKHQPVWYAVIDGTHGQATTQVMRDLVRFVPLADGWDSPLLS
jgi:hypothetical protein